MKYKSAFGEELSWQQVELTNSDYSQEQYLDGELKRIDEFESGQVAYGSYYLSELENVQTVLNELSAVWETAEMFISKEITGDYTTRNWELYQGIEKINSGQNVYDSNNREIASQKIDISTGEITSVKKTYYLETFGSFIDSGDVMDFGTIEFDYIYQLQIPGQIRIIVNLPGYEIKEHYVSEKKNVLLEPLIREIFIWEDHPYYHSSSPLIPSTTA